jgi:hypothetical protein
MSILYNVQQNVQEIENYCKDRVGNTPCQKIQEIQVEGRDPQGQAQLNP